MRVDSTRMVLAREARAQEWRYAVQIIFASSSPTLSSRSGIANLPGTAIEGVIKSISSRSQQVWPDEGRTTIGEITVDILDVGDALTVELRDQLYNDDAGIRDKELRIYVGWSDDFNEFVRVATAFVDNCSYQDGVYTITARDRTRELREKILEPKKTRLSAALTSTATSISVRSTTGFEMVTHGPSFADAPSSTVGYLRNRRTGEIFRYTGTTSNSFTGVTRGVFRTRPQAIEFNGADPVERWPEIEEYIYIELPGPAMAIALATGILDVADPTPPMLPDHWHLGMDWDTAFDQASWTGIGNDLWDSTDYSKGFPLRLAGFKSDTDGKKLIEQDVLRLCGLYSPTTPDGKLSLRRIARITAQQGYVAALGVQNITKVGALKHDLGAVRNQFQVRYNWDGEEYTRAITVVDAGSIGRNGEAEKITLEFKGLTTERHTERLIRERLQVLADRYAEPPLRLQVTCTPNMNWLEIGDTVRVTLPMLQNHASQAAGTLDHTFEVQRTDINWTTGEVRLDLFASGRIVARTGGNEDSSAVLAAGWYTGTGTNINTLAGYVAGSPSRLTANLTLTGTSDINAAGSIWYHDGDLQIDSGVTITVANQAQLRIKGFFTVAGKIDGAGRGPAGTTDTDTTGGTSTGWARPGTQGYLGPTRPGAGMWFFQTLGDFDYQAHIEPGVTEGKARATAAPQLTLQVSDAGHITSPFPADLRGTSGGAGAQCVTASAGAAPGSGGTVTAKGGAGGAGGAGLMLVCRGLGFSVAGVIDLSGTDGALGAVTAAALDHWMMNGQGLYDKYLRAGSGAGGMPGTLYVLLDGDGVPYPDINALTVVQEVGDTPADADAATSGFIASGGGPVLPWLKWPTGSEGLPRVTGYNPHAFASGNLWSAASMVQYVPATGDGSEDVVPAPTDLTASGNVGFVSLSWTSKPGWDRVEIFASSTNDRTYAEEVGEVAASYFNHSLADLDTRYYWIRGIQYLPDGKRVSEWYPSGSTSGVAGAVVSSVAMGGADALTVQAGDGQEATQATLALQTTITTPAGGELAGSVTATADNDANDATQYGGIEVIVDDPTASAEDGKIVFKTIVGGTVGERAAIGDGMTVGAPTGGDPGAGGLNAEALQINGVDIRIFGRATEAAATSGTYIDFTGLPSWVKRVNLLLDGVSLSGTTGMVVQIGDSGGIEPTGYVGSVSGVDATTVASTTFTTWFQIDTAGAAGATRSGRIVLENICGNTWVCSGIIGRSDTSRAEMVGGSKTLSGTLDRVRLTGGNGTDTFDAGTVNITWE